MKEAHLYIGTEEEMEEIASWTLPNYSALPLNVSLSRRFDSTHFEDGADVNIVFVAKDSEDRIYYATDHAIVQNHALIGDFDTNGGYYLSFPTIHNMFIELKNHWDVGRYSKSIVATEYFTFANIKPKIAGANFIYMTSHGAPTVYDVRDVDSEGIRDHMSAADDADSHEIVVQDAMGSLPFLEIAGYPPHNPSMVPPANFIFIDACETMKGYLSPSKWAEALYPQINFILWFGGRNEKPVCCWMEGLYFYELDLHCSPVHILQSDCLLSSLYGHMAGDEGPCGLEHARVYN